MKLKCPTVMIKLLCAAQGWWKPVFYPFFFFVSAADVKHPFQWKHGCSRVIKRHLLFLNRHLSVRLARADGVEGVLSRHNGGGWNYFCFPWDSSSAKLLPLFCVGLKKLHPAVQFCLAVPPQVEEAYVCVCVYKHFDTQVHVHTVTPQTSVLCLCLSVSVVCLSLIVPVIPININV